MRSYRPCRWFEYRGALDKDSMTQADLGWRRQHALSVWNAAMSVLMALALQPTTRLYRVSLQEFSLDQVHFMRLSGPTCIVQVYEGDQIFYSFGGGL